MGSQYRHGMRGGHLSKTWILRMMRCVAQQVQIAHAVNDHDTVDLLIQDLDVLLLEQILAPDHSRRRHI